MKQKRVNTYLIGGIVVFLIMFVVGRLIGFSWIEAAGASAVLAVVGIVSIWWKEVGF
ncbi:MAG TPA: hypothetical protein PKM21_08130 [Anaerolineales bacterium]|nr:hypothetical protein [Anaerolineales bacterium]